MKSSSKKKIFKNGASVKSFLILLLMCIPFLLSGCSGQSGDSSSESSGADSVPDSPETTPDPRDSGNLPSENLTVRIFKSGKADAIVLLSGGRVMVIDCGETDDGGKIIDFLMKNGISRIDCMEITHFDKDHVGGAAAVAAAFPIDRILLPDYEGTRPEYEEFMSTLKENNLIPERLSEPVTFSLGEADVLVETPDSYEIPDDDDEYDNNFSLITTVTHGACRLLFTGDIEKDRIREWVGAGHASKCDFIKMPHHGNYNKQLSSLLDAVQPQYAAICDSDKNPAEEKTLKLLQDYGVETMETKDGDITVTSDGASLTMSH